MIPLRFIFNVPLKSSQNSTYLLSLNVMLICKDFRLITLKKAIQNLAFI